MKYLILSSLLLVIPLTNLGCKTYNANKQEAIAYKSLGAIVATVDAALKSYAEVYVSGSVTEDKHNQVVRIHNKYRVSMAAAIAAAKLNMASPAPEEVTNLAQALVGLIKEVL